MYNLDIANLDNFYVGEQGWLVHNQNGFQPIDYTYEMAQNKQLYIDAITERYGFNLRGIQILYDSSLDPINELGLTKKIDGGLIVRVGPGSFNTSDNLLREANVAETIAHELRHARNYLKGLNIYDELDAIASGESLRNYILRKGCM
jgi:hypothetical protein